MHVLRIHFVICILSIIPCLLPKTLKALDFKTFCFQGQHMNLFFLEGENEVPIEINSYRISKKYTYKGESPIVIYTHVKDEEGKLVPSPVVQYPFGPRFPSLLFLFSQLETGALNIYPIANDDASHPPGAYRIQNLTPHTIALLINKKAYQLTPQQLQVIAPPPPQKRTINIDPNATTDSLNTGEIESFKEKDADDSSLVSVAVPDKIPVQMQFKLPDGNWQPAYNRKWLYRADIRTYVFAHVKNNSVMLKQFVEFIR